MQVSTPSPEASTFIPQPESSDHSSRSPSDESPHSSSKSPAPAPSEDPTPAITLRHSSQITSLPSHLRDFHRYTALATLHEPHFYREASTNLLWKATMTEELNALFRNRTWVLVDLPPDKSVVGCFTKEYDIDYEETFALVARLSSVRILLAVTASRQWKLFQINVKNAFLNGDLSEEVYMQPPPGLSHPPDKNFEMKDLGHLSYFLGLEITSSDDGFYLTQAKYTSDLLSRAGLIDHKIVDTLIELNARLTPSGKPLPDPTIYQQLESQFMPAPRSTHYADVLCILQYLKGTLFHGPHFSAQSPLILRAYSDADWAGDPSDHQSTTGYCFLLGSSLISWRSMSTSSATPIYCDNRSAIQIARNDVFHKRTKHIKIDCHLVRHHLLQGFL
uniref:Reverse transcriptase Ty1/copia-type domain-containing protein n=1 Tax=Fagus sylvatica TaxID=28930 RepID=A0A2N9F1Z3_FAGSY